MATDLIQLLRDNWSDVPEADEQTAQRAYARAVGSGQRRGPGGSVSRLRLIVAVAVVAVLAAAAAVYGITTDRGTTTGGNNERAVAPTPVADAKAADALLPFSVVLPTDATATSLTVSERAEALYGHFESAANGTYVLDEQPSELTVADLQRFDQHWHPTATHSVVVVDGVTVLIQAWPDGSLEAQWFRGEGHSQVLSWVEGPDASQGSGQTFSQRQALSVVTDIISQGG